VHLLTWISSVYGTVRGYDRLAIRRRVAANERLTRDALARMNDEAFQAHVHRSIARFPFYAERVRAHRGSLPAPGERVRTEELPVWTRADQRAFFARQTRPDDAFYAHQTSGSTALPVRFYVTRESYEWRTAIMDRAYGWGEAEEGRKSVYVWATDHAVPPLATRIKRTVHLAMQRRVYFDAFLAFSDEEKRACCALINRTKPHALVGYTSQLVEVARFVRDHPDALTWKARTMVSAAEGLQPGQRELLRTYLVDDVFLSYGSREFMSVGMECRQHAGYHVNADNLRVEVVDDAGRPVAPGVEGRIVITDLRNAATPFIRYEIGDIGTMGPGEPCPCGKPFPLLASVDGRLHDLVYTPHGSVSGLYLTYTMRQFDDWIEGYQVVQDTRDRVLVRLITRSELTPERLAPVTALLREKLRDMTIDYERVNELERRRTGKVALVISSIPQE
jgi:phenylacetate-coenzyme A ligase PaaK-like adenylate-forming protein